MKQKQNVFFPFFLIVFIIYVFSFIENFWLKISIITCLNIYLTYFYFIKVKKGKISKNDIIKIIMSLLIPAIIFLYFYFSV